VIFLGEIAVHTDTQTPPRGIPSEWQICAVPDIFQHWLIARQEIQIPGHIAIAAC